MPPTLRSGLILGFSVVAWTFVMGFTGWHTPPSLHRLFWLVIPLQIGVLLWTLRGIAAENGYGRQLWTGVGTSVLASVLIYAGSLLATSVVFPDYFQKQERLGRELMAKKGLSPEAIEQVVQAQKPLQTSRASAMAGAIGTVVTGFLVTAVAAVAFRRK